MVTNLFFPLDFSVDGSMENVCKEISSRLDPKLFNIFAFSSKDKISAPHVRLIKVPVWKYCMKIPQYVMAAGKICYCLPKLSSVPFCILNTISMPQHVIFYQYKKRDKLVHTFHGVPIFDQKCYFSGKILSRKADVVISVSKYCALLVKRCYGVDSKIIYNGVDTNFFRPQIHHNSRLKILFVGRFRKIKRPWYVIKLAKEFPQCDFLIYGLDYPLGPMLKQISRNLRNVKINPFTSHEKLRYVYSNSDIFFYPSIYEGFSLSVLEAAASGLPIVCSNAASLPEFVEHGEEGFLFNNYKEAKTALSYLIEDESARREMGKNSRSLSFDFDWSKIAEQYEQLYLKLDQKT